MGTADCEQLAKGDGMNPLLIGTVLDFGKSLIERFFPNPEEAAKAEAELVKMAAAGELQAVLAQLDINAKEAQSSSWWVAGWRPYFGWVGGTGFGYAVLLQPLLAWGAAIAGWPIPPEINVDLLWVVISGLLGIGGLRTFEKKAGVAR